MNRNAEYEQLLRQLEETHAPEGCVAKAARRARRGRNARRSVAGIAAAFALFVLLVNVSTTVASACAGIPGLRELAAAVTFSRSLGDAVRSDYVQPVDLSETDEEITVKVEYLIVDQKNVTVFFRVFSERYPHLEIDPLILSAEGEAPQACSYGINEWGVPNGELRSLTVGFLYDDVPPAMRIRLKLRDLDTPREPTEDVWAVPEAPEDYVAEFEFLLEFDPYFTAQGRHYAPDAALTLCGQTLRVTNVDIYPSYLNLTVEGDGANTAWLKSLRFYLVTDRGERFDTVKNGVTATGSPDTPEMICYRADSTFFYDAKSVTLYVTGAEWLDKDAQAVHIDLKNGKADGMPEDSALLGAKREGDRWVVTVLQRQGSAQVFEHEYRDADGNEYSGHVWFTGMTAPDGTEAPEGYVCGGFTIDGYPYDEVWLRPRYTDVWQADVPVSVTLELK